MPAPGICKTWGSLQGWILSTNDELPTVDDTGLLGVLEV